MMGLQSRIISSNQSRLHDQSLSSRESAGIFHRWSQWLGMDSRNSHHPSTWASSSCPSEHIGSGDESKAKRKAIIHARSRSLPYREHTRAHLCLRSPDERHDAQLGADGGPLAGGRTLLSFNRWGREERTMSGTIGAMGKRLESLTIVRYVVERHLSSRPAMTGLTGMCLCSRTCIRGLTF
jgi:hypothetical protein